LTNLSLFIIIDTTVGNRAVPKLVDLDQKKAEIAHKALYAFAFEGYHKTSLGAIARMCGIGRTTIYEYFKDKDEIFSYTLNHSFDLLQPDFRQILQQPGLTSLERIAAILRVILTQFYRTSARFSCWWSTPTDPAGKQEVAG
jgi:AcrR family transcriptional regulator